MSQEDSNMPDLETRQESVLPPRIHVDIRRAESVDISGMISIFSQAFHSGDPRLAQLMHGDRSGDELQLVVWNILNTYLDSPDCDFMVAYDNEVVQYESDMDNSSDLESDMNNSSDLESDMDNSSDLESHTDKSSDIESNMENLTLGWIAVGVVPHGVISNAYAATELVTYACLDLLGKQARAMGENYLSPRDSRVRLLYELQTRSKDGQARYIANPHLVVNTLVLWPESDEYTDWEMAFKLLAWAVSFAERRNLPIWAQIPVNQTDFFCQAGFREVRAFTLNLNRYAPPGSTENRGTQEWKQMVFRAPEERRVSSMSREGGRRQRRLSF